MKRRSIENDYGVEIGTDAKMVLTIKWCPIVILKFAKNQMASYSIPTGCYIGRVEIYHCFWNYIPFELLFLIKCSKQYLLRSWQKKNSFIVSFDVEKYGITETVEIT